MPMYMYMYLPLTDCGDVCVIVLFVTVSVHNAGFANIGVT